MTKKKNGKRKPLSAEKELLKRFSEIQIQDKHM